MDILTIRYLILEFEARTFGSFRRDELQDFLDRREADGLSYSTVAHLRWDMRQIFKLAVAEGFIQRNPAELLFVPRGCPRPNTRNMTPEGDSDVFRP
jgi:site-specific recombinase XerD